MFELAQAGAQHSTLCTLHVLSLLNYTNFLYVFDNEQFVDRNVLLAHQSNYITRNLNLHYAVLVPSRQDLFLINCESLERIRIFLEEIYRTIAWNRDAIYLLVNVNPENLADGFEILWSFYCSKTLILTKTLHLYSFSPITQRTIKPNYLGNRTDFKIPNFDHDLLYFNNLEIRVGSVKLPPYVINEEDPVNPGYEVVMMREIAERIKIVYKYLKHNETNHGGMIDGKLTGLYGLLERREIDMVVGGSKSEGYLVGIFDGSECYSAMQMGVFTPPAKIMRASKKVLYIFNVTIWALILLVIIFILLPLTFYKKHFQKRCSLIDNFLILLQLCFTTNPVKENHIFPNMILLVWTIGSFLLITIFNNTFMTFLALPSYENQITTLEGILQAKLKLGGYIVSRKIVSGQNSTFQKLYANWINCTLQGVECIDDVINGKLALLKNVRSLRYRLGTLGSKKVHLATILSINYLWLLLEKNLPIYKRFNAMIMRMHENGLMKLWENQAMRMRRGEATEQKRFLKLQIGFLILIGGHVLATIVFLSEIFRHKKKL